MPGVECVGLVLAVLPLVIEAAKAYKSGVDTIVDVLSSSRRDAKLEEFYEELWWEVFFLDRQLRDVVRALPFLTAERKAEMLDAEKLDEWTSNYSVQEALQEYFNSETDSQAFMVIMRKIVQLLAQLIKDSATPIRREDVDQIGMYRKLKAFEQDRRSQTTSSSAKERLRFWKREKDRKTCLRALRTWNKNLLCLTEEARREPITKKTTQIRTGPPLRLREASRILYQAMAARWTCSCPSPHQAQFCLGPQSTSLQTQPHTNFEFLFSSPALANPERDNWMEGTVLLRSAEEARKYEGAALDRICDALRRGMSSHCLNLLVEQAEDEPTLWQLRPQAKRSRIVDSIPAVSLESLLCNSHRLPLIAKRKLAVTLARSLLQLHEGLWLGRDWSKRQIMFFHEATMTIDYQKPYVMTRFDTNEHETPDFSLFHRNASILALGILLIEIHTGKPIEKYRTAADLTGGTEVNANADWTVADRVVKSLDDCSLGYKEAIQACLDTPWVPAAQRVSLDDELTRKGLFADVVQPLEDEVDYLFREKF